MDPTPNEAEMREAAEWCRGELASSGEPPYPINAYAAALAKCREERINAQALAMAEGIAAERERYAKKLKQWAEDAYVNYIRKCDSDLCRGLDFKLSHGEFTKQNLKAHCEASEHFGKHKGFLEAAAAIRGGAE